MKALIVGGIAKFLGQTSEVTEQLECEGLGTLYRLAKFPTEQGLELWFQRSHLVLLS